MSVRITSLAEFFDNREGSEAGVKPSDKHAWDTALGNYLRRRYIKPKPGFIARILGDTSVFNYDIIEVAQHTASRHFKRHKLFWIGVGDSYLEHSKLPSRNSWGIFAFSDLECLHLSKGDTESFSRLLKAEGNVPLMPEMEFAQLVCDTLLSDKSEQFTPLAAYENLESITSRENGYILCEENIPVVSSILKPPTLDIDNSYVKLRFFALSGWKHECNKLSQIELKIDPDYRFELKLTVECDKVFSSSPVIIY